MAEAASLAILFADISGSTRLYDRVGDQRALSVIARCLDMFCSVAVARGGRVIKTIGDELLASFPSTHGACLAATDIQLRMTSAAEAVEHGLLVHCGIHWGEVMVTEDDLFGDTVNVAARLTEVAKRGQIVLSGEALQSLPASSGLTARLMGTEPVRGKAALLELHELLWEPDAELTEMARTTLPARAAAMALVLTYLGKDYQVDDLHPIITLGRGPEAGIVTLDRQASRLHGRIEMLLDRFRYTDMSSNGTFVCLTGQDEVFTRRESIILQGGGTISFGRPYDVDPDAALRFVITQRSPR